jgi:hypothetical protein
MSASRLRDDAEVEQPPQPDATVIARRSAPWIGRELIIRDSTALGVALLYWIRLEHGPEVRVATVAYGPGETPKVGWGDDGVPEELAPDRDAIESWVAVEVASWRDRTAR